MLAKRLEIPLINDLSALDNLPQPVLRPGGICCIYVEASKV